MKVPFVSILLPVRNESIYIERVLQALLNQDYPGKMEILIADGMSTDGTRTIIQKIAREHPEMDIRVLDNPQKIVPTGLNIALREARGEFILRVDGHTVIAPDYVRQCVELLSRTKAENVGGRMNASGHNMFGKAVALATSTPFGIGNARFHYSNQEEWVDTVYMGAWPRRIFETIGMFDEELVRDQDDEFNCRLRENGGRILLSPRIHSQYTVRSSSGALWKQYFQYGFWKVRVLQKHPRQMSIRQFVPPLFVIAIVFSIGLGVFYLNYPKPVILAAALLVPVSYLIASIIFSLNIAKKHGWQYFSYLPIVFATLHVSYGLGFLMGLIRFWNRWGDNIGKVPLLAKNTNG